MTSITSQNLSTAAAGTDAGGALRSGEAKGQNQNLVNGPQTSHQRMQASSQAAVIFARSDKTRPTEQEQIDASFASQEDRPQDSTSQKAKKKSSNNPTGNQKVDMVA